MVMEEKSLGNDLCISEGGQISVTLEFKLPAGSNVVGLVFLTRCWGDSFSGNLLQKYCQNHLSSFGAMTQGIWLPCHPCSSGATTWEGQLPGHPFCPLSFDVETDKSVSVDLT